MKRLTALVLTITLLLGTLTACARETAVPSTQASQSEATEAAVLQTQPAPTELAQTDVIPADIEITEVMSDNRNLTLGHEKDWVELYNPGDVSADLSGFYLTDDLSQPQAMPLTGYSVPAGGFLVIALEKDGPFQLSEMGENVYLTQGDSQVSALAFGKAADGASFDNLGACKYPTPGFANSEEGYRAYLEAMILPELVISEVLADNSVYAVDGMFYDYIEVENRSDAAVNLGEYYLADRWENTKRYQFPDITLEPGAFYLVFCSGTPELGENHAPFSIGSGGETLYLAHRGTFTDALCIPRDLKTNESFGRSGNLPVYLNAPTPGGVNTEGILGGVAVPAASVASGEYDQPVTVELAGEGTIYYTLDGSRPTENSAVYSGPITIDGVATIRAICAEGGRTSAIANYTYVVGKEHDLPVLVISIPLASRESLLKNIESSQEYEAVMVLFEDGEEKFSVPFGMRLHGNDSRKGAKKNFQLRFRGEYGAGKLEYRLFENRDIDEFDSLLLKGGSEDFDTAMLRDELASMIADGTSALYTLAVKPVVLYLGGEYWGIHYLRERFSDEYVASHLDVSPESVDLLFSTSGAVQTGSNRAFNALKNYIKNNDMSTPENYAYLAEQIDVNSLIDWYAFRTYLDDRDLANIRRFRSTESDGKWRWMFFDMDWGLYKQSEDPVSDILEDYNGEPIVIKGLLASEAGRDAFLTRYAYLMRTALNEEYIIGCMDEILSQIESEMDRDRERWGKSYPWWEANVAYIREFARDDVRVELILNDLRNYFTLTSEQMEYYFGDLLEK